MTDQVRCVTCGRQEPRAKSGNCRMVKDQGMILLPQTDRAEQAQRWHVEIAAGRALLLDDWWALREASYDVSEALQGLHERPTWPELAHRRGHLTDQEYAAWRREWAEWVLRRDTTPCPRPTRGEAA